MSDVGKVAVPFMPETQILPRRPAIRIASDRQAIHPDRHLLALVVQDSCHLPKVLGGLRIVQPFSHHRSRDALAFDTIHEFRRRTEWRVGRHVADMSKQGLVRTGVVDEIQRAGGDPGRLRQLLGKRQWMCPGRALGPAAGGMGETLLGGMDVRSQIDAIGTIVSVTRDIGPGSRERCHVLFRMLALHPVEPFAAAIVFGAVHHVEAVGAVVVGEAFEVRPADAACRTRRCATHPPAAPA